MTYIQLDDLPDARYGRDVLIVQAVTRINDEATTVAIAGRVLDALKLGQLFVAPGLRILSGMQLDDRRANGRGGIQLFPIGIDKQ